MKVKILYSFLLFFNIASAQKEDHTWLFGGGFQFNKDSILDPTKEFGPFDFDFNTDPMTIRPNKKRLNYVSDDNHSYSDKDGNLLLYTNGMQVYDNNYELIDDTLNYSTIWDYRRGYINDTSIFVLGAAKSQFSLLLPVPETDNEYVIFCHNMDVENFEVKHLKMNKYRRNEDKTFEVVFKDSIIVTGFKLSQGGLTACRHANGRDWWVLVGSESFFSIRSYLLTKDSFILKKNNVTNTSLIHQTGQAKFSSDGSKLVIGTGYSFGAENGMTRIFDFNRETGALTNVKFEIYPYYFYGKGAEISLSGKFGYTTKGDTIWQYDLSKEDPIMYKKVVSVWDSFGYISPKDVNDPPYKWINAFSLMQLAPDGKIYISAVSGGNRLFGVINYPDEEGEACQVKQHSIFTRWYYRTMPTFPHYRLGPLDGSASDTLGIDNHPIAKFRYEGDSTNHLNVRFTDLSYFRPETWHWDFGDGATFEGRKPYWHEFPKNGTYNVCLTVSNENSENTMCRLVNIGSTSNEELKVKNEKLATVFPNPTEGEVLLTLSDYIPEEGMVYVYDMMGKEVYKQRVYYGWNNVNLIHLSNGQYMYQVFDKNHKISQGSIIKI